MRILTFVAGLILLLSVDLKAQALAPGFDKDEYREIIYAAARSSEGPEKAKLIPHSSVYDFSYRSQPIGLDNLWELWIDKKKTTAVIIIRGTTASSESWLANLYAGMVKAKGYLRLSTTDTFHYELSQHPRAAVHVGYLLSTAYLSKDILPKIDSCYQAGIRNFIIMGHSQGGAISYLMTAYLYNQQKTNRLPADIRFKTYSSAAPKPGNLYFAYSYEAMTAGGWAFNVVNTDDWVPQTPFSVQVLDDFNRVSPLPFVEKVIKEQPFLKRLFIRGLYNKLQKPSNKAMQTYQRFLGKEMGKRINKYLPDFIEPEYENSSDYVRTGTTIVLQPNDDAYYQQFPNDSKDFFIHHSFPPYLYLLDKMRDN